MTLFEYLTQLNQILWASSEYRDLQGEVTWDDVERVSVAIATRSNEIASELRTSLSQCDHTP